MSATVLSGSVTNARGLTSAGHGDTTLTVTAASEPATVLLDYGVEVEGMPYLDIASYNGTSPAVSLAFTEAKAYLHTPGSSTLAAAAPAGATTISVQIEGIGLGTAQFAFRDRTATASGHNSHSGSDLAFSSVELRGFEP